MTEHIKTERKNGIVTLAFARPDKKNALTNAMYGVLADTLISAETDPAARVIVLRGEGDMFTSGNDVGEFAAIAVGGLLALSPAVSCVIPGCKTVQQLESNARAADLVKPGHPQDWKP